MNKFTYKLASGLAAASLLALTVVPSAFAWSGNSINGNGAFSRNNVRYNNFRPVNVSQNNYSRFNNNVNTYQNTGYNTADFNTGGDVSINTGSANSSVNISNEAGMNHLMLYGDGGMY